LIGLAADQLPDRLPQENVDRHEDWRRRLHAQLQKSVRHRCRNPMVAWLLMYVLTPIVVRLVLEWWFNRKE